MFGEAILGLLQASFEVARLDRPNKGVDRRRNPLRLARRDRTLGERRGDRLHRGGDVGGAFDGRQCEINGALAAWRQGGAFVYQADDKPKVPFMLDAASVYLGVADWAANKVVDFILG